MVKRDTNARFEYLEVTNGPIGSQPLAVDPSDSYWENCEGHYFDDDGTGPPFVSYVAYHSQLMDVVNTPS